MKTILLLSMSIFFAKLSSAQYAHFGPGEKQYKQFLTTTTLVVLSDNSDFDEHLKSAFAKYWTHTKVAFISVTDFREKMGLRDYTFFIPLWTGSPGGLFRAKNKKLYFEGFRLIPGDKKNLKRLEIDSNKRIICGNMSYFDVLACGFNDTYNESTPYDMEYRIDDLVKSVNQSLHNVKKITSPFAGFDHKTFYNAQSKIYNDKFKQETLKEKTLLIYNSDLEKKQISKVSNSPSLLLNGSMNPNENMSTIWKDYPYPVEFLSQQEFSQKVNSKDNKYAYLIRYTLRNNQYTGWSGGSGILGPSVTYLAPHFTWVIYDASTGDIIYTDAKMCDNTISFTPTVFPCFLKNLLGKK